MTLVLFTNVIIVVVSQVHFSIEYLFYMCVCVWKLLYGYTHTTIHMVCVCAVFSPFIKRVVSRAFAYPTMTPLEDHRKGPMAYKILAVILIIADNFHVTFRTGRSSQPVTMREPNRIISKSHTKIKRKLHTHTEKLYKYMYMCDAMHWRFWSQYKESIFLFAHLIACPAALLPLYIDDHGTQTLTGNIRGTKYITLNTRKLNNFAEIPENVQRKSWMSTRNFINLLQTFWWVLCVWVCVCVLCSVQCCQPCDGNVYRAFLLWTVSVWWVWNAVSAVLGGWFEYDLENNCKFHKKGR